MYEFTVYGCFKNILSSEVGFTNTQLENLVITYKKCIRLISLTQI